MADSAVTFLPRDVRETLDLRVVRALRLSHTLTMQLFEIQHSGVAEWRAIDADRARETFAALAEAMARLDAPVTQEAPADAA